MPTTFELIFYTDFRSDKVGELQQNPTLTWLFWHPRQQLQIKAIGKVTLERQTENTQQIWNNMHEGAKAAYITRSAPGTPIEHLGATELESTDDEALHHEHFTVITCRIERVEMLQLNREQHTRARFELENETWKSTWLVP